MALFLKAGHASLDFYRTKFYFFLLAPQLHARLLKRFYFSLLKLHFLFFAERRWQYGPHGLSVINGIPERLSLVSRGFKAKSEVVGRFLWM